ncbi:MAG TPA: ABC transporter permease [Opitutaceae bacterium]|jgi:putative ABC transport system permease protein
MNPKTGQGFEFQEGDFLEMAKLPCVSSAMATNPGSVLMRGDLTPEIIHSPHVSPSAFAFLGVPPILGRGLFPSDFRPNGETEPVAVLSFQLWQKRFDGDSDVIGRTIMLNDEPHKVVGVMPPRFGWYTDDGLWLPLPTTDRSLWVRPILRLNPGVSSGVAEQQLKALLLRIAKDSPDRFPKGGWTVSLFNYLDITSLSDELRSSLRLLRYAVICLLLIACTNVTNLLLARGTTRSREIAIRLAMGAGRARVVRQLLTEGVLLAFLGGTIGLLFAYGLTHVIVALIPAGYLPNESRVTINLWVLGFTFLVSLATGILAALAPAIRCTRADLNDALKSGGQNTTAGTRTMGLRNTLAICEVALAVVLLVGAGLAIRGFAELTRLVPGYDLDNLLVARVSLQTKNYATIGQRDGFVRDALERFRVLPGVLSACVGTPPHFDRDSTYAIAGATEPAHDRISVNFVSAEYLSTFRIPLIAGRNLTAAEAALGDPVALITQAAARLWPAGVAPIGRTITLDSLAAPSASWDLAPAKTSKELTVVGIVGDVRNYPISNPRSPFPPDVFAPYSLRGSIRPEFILRTQGNPKALVGAVRATLRDLDKDIPMFPAWSADKILVQEGVQPRFNASLFTALGVSALALAVTGIYGVLSYSVSQRTREIGLRIALGARGGAIQRLVLRNGMVILGIGLLAGLALSEGLTTLVRSQVFVVPPNDPVVFILVSALFGAAAIAACLLPARRAARVDPNVVLRLE